MILNAILIICSVSFVVLTAMIARQSRDIEKLVEKLDALTK